MSWFKETFTTSIGRKFIMALTGLLLVLFLIGHLTGNLLLLKDDGGKAFNDYAHFMKTTPVVYIAEVILFAGFIFHIIDGIVLTIKNRQSRPEKYAYNNPKSNSSWFSRNMGLTGSVLFIFLVIHLKTFFVPSKITNTLDITLYDKVVEAFSSPVYTGFYVFAMILMGFHLNHGFQSAFQTLSWRHPKYYGFIKKFGTAFAIIIPAGFAFIPIYFCFIN